LLRLAAIRSVGICGHRGHQGDNRIFRNFAAKLGLGRRDSAGFECNRHHRPCSAVGAHGALRCSERTEEPYDRKAQVSLRSELVGMGVRSFIKRRRRPTVAAARRSILAAARWVPRPPAGTEVLAVDAGGVPGEFVATAASRLSRHVLFLHGGGYVTGSPALYRHFTWR